MKKKNSYARQLGFWTLITLASAGAQAEDIDIYQGTASIAGGNLLMILDNAAAASGSLNVPVTCAGLTVNDPQKNLGFEQCGLYSAVRAIGTSSSLKDKINLGLMYFPPGGAYGGTFVLPDASPPPNSLEQMDDDGVDKMLQSVEGLSLVKDKSNNNQIAQAMQESWAFYRGKTGLSGTNYPGLADVQACTRNFVLYITLATSNQKPQDNGDRGGAALQSAAQLSTLPAQVSLPAWQSPISGAMASGKYRSDYSDEWAAYMRKSAGITTYTIILSDGANPDYEQLMASVAIQGGSDPIVVELGDVKAFVDALTRIFREVQSVNSVFAAPVLPVSANTQGTYINQVYMGMFRPDVGGNPRWIGNLKQFQLGVDITDPNAPELFLADASWGPYTAGTNARRALSAGGTGFITPTAISFWTAKNTDNLPDAWEGFWRNAMTAQQAEHGFDWEDGQVVEKGGVSQQIRLKHLTDSYSASSSASSYASARNVLTCVGTACAADAALRTMPFKTSNSGLSDQVLGMGTSSTTMSTAAAKLIDWVRGADTRAAGDTAAGAEASSPPIGTNQNDPAITIRGSVHGDVLHSRPAVINYGGTTGVVVFYGANDGLLRAINGNQPPKSTKPSSDANLSRQPMGNCTISDTCAIPVANASGVTTQVPPGGELWSFVPQEFFPGLQKLYKNSEALTLGSTSGSGKAYFFDGAPGIYYNGAAGTARKAYLYLSARRGGRLLYALDVSDPTNPKFMWKRSNADTGFEELGQTWSQPKVARIKGHTNPVLIFGAGYAPEEDAEPPKADTMGRGIFILDAVTGEQLWRAVPADVGVTASSCANNVCSVAGMNYAIPADITLVDRDFDGLIDRLYAADTGGNIWRVDLQPTGSGERSTWQATLLAALGGGADSTTKRKFFYSPDVVLTRSYDVVIDVTGDREHPLLSHGASAIVNRFYMIKDRNTGNSASGWAAVRDDTSSTANVPPTSLFQVTQDTPYDGTLSGFYVTLGNSGEKGVNAPTTVGGNVYFGTNRPLALNSNTCLANLGEARSYQVNFLKGTTSSTLLDGGGLVPSPVFGIVTVNVGGTDRQLPFLIGGGGGKGADGKSGLGAQKPVITLNATRKRTYWFRETDR